MNDTELRKEMFAWYGAAMYSAQLFEVELVILLLALKRLRDPDSEPSDYCAFRFVRPAVPVSSGHLYRLHPARLILPLPNLLFT